MKNAYESVKISSLLACPAPGTHIQVLAGKIEITGKEGYNRKTDKVRRRDDP